MAQARNRALDEVDAPFLAFLDDDQIPERRWLATLLSTFDSVKPSPSVVGGRMRLRWPDRQPNWMPNELLGLYGRLDYDEEVRQVRIVNSGNMVFPTGIMRPYRFNLKFGPVGRKQLTGEDTEIQMRMRRDGHSICYQPTAVAWHVNKRCTSLAVRRWAEPLLSG